MDGIERELNSLKSQIIDLQRRIAPFSDPRGVNVRTQLQPRRRIFAQITDFFNYTYPDGSQVWYSWKQIAETPPTYSTAGNINSALSRGSIDIIAGGESGEFNAIDLNNIVSAIGKNVELVESPFDTGIWYIVNPPPVIQGQTGFVSSRSSQFNTSYWVPLGADIVTSFGITGDTGGTLGHGYWARIMGTWGMPPVGTLTKIKFRQAALTGIAGAFIHGLIIDNDAKSMLFSGRLPPATIDNPGTEISITTTSINGSFQFDLFNQDGTSHTYAKIEGIVEMTDGTLLGINTDCITTIGLPGAFVNPPFIG